MANTNLIKGRAYVFARGHINTDEIIPARYLNMNKDSELAVHAMEDIDSSFASVCRKGDIIVAGEDFGCGSSREHAVWALRGAGVSCVVADSFARIFFRNALNNGFAAVECPGVSLGFKTGDEISVDLDNGIVRNVSSGREFRFAPYTGFAKKLIDSGGLMEHVKKSSR